jgi:hypothetical protein
MLINDELGIYESGGPAIDTPIGMGSVRLEILGLYEFSPARTGWIN